MKRFWHHRWKLNNNSHDNRHLQNAWNKYGSEDFYFQMVYTINKNEDMNNLEIYYIEKYKAFTNGFNLTTGGEGKKNAPMSEEAKRIVGEKNRKHNLGKKHSKETRRKMSESQKRLGRKLSEEHKKLLIESRLGSKHTEESKEKMRLSHLGSKNVVAKINEEQAYSVKQRLISGERIIDIAEDTDINYAIIKSIVANKVWQHVEVEGWELFLKSHEKKKKKLLSDEKVKEIRKLIKDGYNAPQVAELCGVPAHTVYRIRQNKSYRHVK